MTTTTLLRASLLALLLLGPIAAQESQPAQPTLGSVLQAAREAKVLVEGTRREFFKGQNPGVALVEHEARVTKEGLSSAFTEHAPSGAFVRSTYRIDAEGVLQEVKVERGTRDSYPDATETTSYLREPGELVQQVKEGEKAERSQLPQDAIPMSVVTFLLPTLAAHLPEKLAFTPLFEAQVHGQTMALTRATTKGGTLLGIEVEGQAAITIDVDSKGRVKQLNAPGGNVIKQLTTEAGEAALAKLRPA
tara:strand:+ start:166 stop:909 length:744 start_codon:yes stop_codon:yes gene_type:complete